MGNTAATPTRVSGVDIYLTVCCQETINNGRYGKRRRGVCGLCCDSLRQSILIRSRLLLSRARECEKFEDLWVSMSLISLNNDNP